MRITNKMTTMRVLNNIQTNYSALSKVNDQLSSGRKISVPHDDPVGAVKSMSYRSNLQEIEQYIENVSSSENILNATDTALGQTTNILQRIRELTVEGAHDTYEQSSRDAIADEISELLDEIQSLGNSQVAGRYIFGGYSTTEPPFKGYTGTTDYLVDGPGADLIHSDGSTRTGINSDNITVIEYKGDSGKLITEIDENVKTTYSVSGEDIFGKDASALTMIIELANNIYKGNIAGIESGLGDLDEITDNILKNRAEIGAKMNRLEQSNNRLEDKKLSVTDLLSKTEDTDVTEAIIELNTRESIQQMSLNVGARIIQPTLMDFLS